MANSTGIVGERHGQQSLLRQTEQPQDPGTDLVNRGHKKYRLTFLFAGIALVVIAVAALIVNHVIGGLAEDQLIRLAEENTSRDALHIQSMMRGQHSMIGIGAGESMADAMNRTGNATSMMDSQSMSMEHRPLTLELLAGPTGLPTHFPMLVEGMGIVKSSLYDNEGKTMWSTDSVSIYSTKVETTLFQKAAAGQVASKLIRDLEIVHLDGVSRSIDVVETYVPLRESAMGPIVGVMGIYRDISSDAGLLVDETKSAVMWTTVMTMAGLFIILLGFVIVADGVIHRSRKRELALIEEQLEERERAKAELQQAHDAAVEATRAKSDFLASMSHEIRTPMNSIIGMAELLSNTPLNSEQQQYVQIFTKAGDTLLTLIDDVLDLSKVEAGQLILETVDFDLIELIEDTAEYLAIRAHAKGLELNCSISHDVPTTVVGDPGRLRQVLTNLVGNAIKFTEEGEVTLRIETYPGASNDSFVLFRVSDTGIGIHPEQLDKIFDDFTQADSSMTRKFGGTGLGLAIARRLVEMMEGRIWAESEIGHGSTFYFTVQLQVGAEPASRAEPTWEDIKGLKTLVVDDNANNRLILQEMLAASGITAKAVEDGYRALVELDHAKKGDDPYQLVLLDRRMPGMDGFQVVERIKDQLGIVDITIMLLTSENRSEDIARCRVAGISRYLVKPVKQSELIQAILVARGVDSAVAEAQPPEATSDTVHEPRVLRILLVEDSEDNRLLVQAHLNDAGHKIDLAENGEVAVEKFVSGQYDLVLMDMQMPVMDGYDATRAIRKWESDQAVEATPIIALTAHALKEDTQKSLDAGCSGHLTKPLKKERLMEAIYEHARIATV